MKRARELLLLAVVGLAFVAPAGCQRSVASPVRYSAGNVAVLRTALGGTGNAAATEAVATAQPTGWGTLKGVFKMVGTPPSPAQLNVSGDDHAICTPGGKPVYSNDIKVDPSGGIANVVVYLETKYPEGRPEMGALPVCLAAQRGRIRSEELRLFDPRLRDSHFASPQGAQ